MYVYRCVFLDEANNSAAAEEIEAEGLREALPVALSILQARPEHRAVEIWDGPIKLYPRASLRLS